MNVWCFLFGKPFVFIGCFFQDLGIFTVYREGFLSDFAGDFAGLNGSHLGGLSF